MAPYEASRWLSGVTYTPTIAETITTGNGILVCDAIAQAQEPEPEKELESSPELDDFIESFRRSA